MTASNWIEQRRHFVILDFDQLQRRFRRLLAGCSYGSDFLADEAHDAIGQHRRVIDATADAQPRHV